MATTSIGPTVSQGYQPNFLRDTGIVFRRQVRIALRNPVWVVIGLMQPILYLALFGPLLEPLTAQLGTTNAYALFVPGLLVQLGMFGAMFAGFGLIGEWRDGVIEAERVTPANRTALLVGRVLRDVLQCAVQGLILVGAALALGLRANFAGIVIGLILVVLLGAACASASYALALTTKSEDTLAPILNSVFLPVLLLSGIFLPMTLAPNWLQRLSDIIPLKHIVEGVRAVFRGDIWSWPALWGTVWTAAILAAGVWVGTRVFRKQNA